MALNLHENPAWLAAVAREREIREAAYLGLCTPIVGGVLLPPLTLRQKTILFAARNPLVFGGAATLEDALVFLWVLDPAYAPENTDARNALWNELAARDLPWPEIIQGLREYYAEQTIDSPRASGSQDMRAPAVSSVSRYVDIFADAYGWTRDYILDSPVLCLDQERRNIQLRGPKGVVQIRSVKTPDIQGGALSNAVKEAVVFERRKKAAGAATNG